MNKVLVIGCGGVAGVAIQKCAQNAEVFNEICIASRTVSKCDALKQKLEGKTTAKITTTMGLRQIFNSAITTEFKSKQAASFPTACYYARISPF